MKETKTSILPFFPAPILPVFLSSILFILCGPSPVLAQEAMVRAHLDTNAAVWVGQKVTAVVEVLAPGYFSSAVTFDLPDPDGMLLLPPSGHPVMSSETINNTSYTVQRYELSAFPIRVGQQSIPAIPVRFSFKHAPTDTNAITTTVTTTPMPFAVKLPPGAENLGQVISARDLKIEETWKPEPGKTKVPAGTAFTRTVTFTAPDVPGMVFPPFPAGQIDGLGIYTKRQLLDQTNDGSLSGGRRDIITYVCQRPGKFTIPAVRFVWFNLDTKELETNNLPAYTFNVIPNRALATATGTGVIRGFASRFVTWWGFTGLIAVVVLLVLFARWRAKLRSVIAGLFIPFRPSHLQPLNPTEQSQQLNRVVKDSFS
jgi:hypothetical protein